MYDKDKGLLYYSKSTVTTADTTTANAIKNFKAYPVGKGPEKIESYTSTSAVTAVSLGSSFASGDTPSTSNIVVSVYNKNTKTSKTFTGTDAVTAVTKTMSNTYELTFTDEVKDAIASAGIVGTDASSVLASYDGFSSIDTSSASSKIYIGVQGKASETAIAQLDTKSNKFTVVNSSTTTNLKVNTVLGTKRLGTATISNVTDSTHKIATDGKLTDGVVIKANGVELVNGTDYTLSGTTTVTVTFNLTDNTKDIASLYDIKILFETDN
jgi:hypothetical protein